MTPKPKGSRGLLLIAAFKIIKGLALLALGVGALKLLHKDVAAEAEQWIDLLRLDPQNPHIQKFLAKLFEIDDKQLKILSLGTFAYAGLFLTEGIGLAFRKRWAEYITIISTASFLPFEIYELVKRVSVPGIVILLANIAIVVYLVLEVRRTKSIPI
jgi:uncharacterized membrane protein (DUF2068 family)